MAIDDDVRRGLAPQITKDLLLKLLEVQPNSLGLATRTGEDTAANLGDRFNTLLTKVDAGLKGLA